jgi:hypothetical protein
MLANAGLTSHLNPRDAAASSIEVFLVAPVAHKDK